MRDSALPENPSEAAGSDEPKSVADRALDLGGQVIEQVSVEVVGQVLENMLVVAPKKAVTCVLDGLGSF